MASKGGREKIKLESTAGTGHFYTTSKNKKNHARKNEHHEIRPQGAQACRIQRNQTQVNQFRAWSRNPYLRASLKTAAHRAPPYNPYRHW